MNPAGVIITYIDWRKWKQWFFNIPLFAFQLTFMVVGKIIGKVDVRWGSIWKAAQASHVRLCLKRKPFTSWYERHEFGVGTFHDSAWQYINFGYPEADLEYWRPEQCDGKRFEYRDPTFTFSQERIDGMIQYAHDQVGKRYDDLQLLSPVVNFLIWVFRPSLWGKEIIEWFNRPGGHEFCSSGATAVLLWLAEGVQVTENIRIQDGDTSEFFPGYHTAMVMPCMFVISEKWKRESNIKIQKRYFDRLVEETTGVPDILRGKDDDRTNH